MSPKQRHQQQRSPRRNKKDGDDDKDRDGEDKWFGYERSPSWSPSWTKTYLKPTGMAEVMRIHGNLAAPITFSPFKKDDDHKNKVVDPKKLRSTQHGKQMKEIGNLASPITHIREHNKSTRRGSSGSSKRISVGGGEQDEVLKSPPQSPKSVIMMKSLEESSFKSPKPSSPTKEVRTKLRRSKSEGKEHAHHRHSHSQSPKKEDKDQQRKLRRSHSEGKHRLHPHRNTTTSSPVSSSLEWEKPSWISKQLKSTDKGEKMKENGNLAAPITFTPFKKNVEEHTNPIANPKRVLRSTELGQEMKQSGNLAKPITHIRDYKVSKQRHSTGTISNKKWRSPTSTTELLLTQEELDELEEEKRRNQENLEKIDRAKALVDFLQTIDARSHVEKRRSSHSQKKNRQLRPHFLNLTTITPL